MSLATLASKSSKRVKMCQDGAIQALIKLSTLNDIAIKRSCASAFSSLASESSIRARMIEEGAFGAIIALSSFQIDQPKQIVVEHYVTYVVKKGMSIEQ